MKRYLKNVVCDVLFRNTGSTTTLLEALTNDHVDVEIVKEEIIKCRLIVNCSGLTMSLRKTYVTKNNLTNGVNF